MVIKEVLLYNKSMHEGSMNKYRIDGYHYCKDKEKERFYREHVLTSEEKH